MQRRYENETEDVILERMLERISDDIDKRQGSVVFDLLSPASIELAQAYNALDDVVEFGLDVNEDTPEEFVDLKVKWSGVTRKPSVKASGVLTFIGDEGTIIEAGTQVRTDSDNPVYFETLTEVEIGESGVVTVNAQAVEGGSNGNVRANAITIVLGDLAGVVSVTNESAFSGGIDQESNEELLKRYYERIQQPATSGNIYHYQQWAKEVVGISDAKVLPLWDGPGTVKVILLNSNKRAPSSVLINEVQTYIDTNRPIGATVTCVGANELSINVSAKLTLSHAGDINTVKAQFEQALTDYLKSLAFTDELVRYTQIANLLLNVQEVIDYENLLINGGTANIHVEDDEVAVIGTVTLS